MFNKTVLFLTPLKLILGTHFCQSYTSVTPFPEKLGSITCKDYLGR